MTKEKLTAPFTARLSGNNGFEIVDANGIVAIWVFGVQNTNIVLAAMNASQE